MKVYAYMERRTGRLFSEDTMLANGAVLKEGFYSFDTTGNCIAIADGVGGNAGGREASEYVLDRCRNELTKEDPRTSILNINDGLLAFAKSAFGMEQMATTLSAILFCDNAPVKIVHVGNTRVMAIQGEYTKQLTKDHTTVELLRARGDYDAAERAPQNEITACMGSGNPARIAQLQIIEVDREYSGYVLTSDGIHDYLDLEDIEDFISSGDWSKQAFEELAQRAKSKGSDDDKSIIIIRVWE
ncbi:MAG: PP2C family protein-serine/threonine phosphatase [Eubacteriales bacterium]|jgi:serine/threonine protein phosphatase PrpC